MWKMLKFFQPRKSFTEKRGQKRTRNEEEKKTIVMNHFLLFARFVLIVDLLSLLRTGKAKDGKKISHRLISSKTFTAKAEGKNHKKNVQKEFQFHFLVLCWLLLSWMSWTILFHSISFFFLCAVTLLLVLSSESLCICCQNKKSAILIPLGDGLLRIMIQFSRLSDDKKNEEIIGKQEDETTEEIKQLPLILCIAARNVDESHEIPNFIIFLHSLLVHLSVIFLTAHFSCLTYSYAPQNDSRSRYYKQVFVVVIWTNDMEKALRILENLTKSERRDHAVNLSHIFNMNISFQIFYSLQQLILRR